MHRKYVPEIFSGTPGTGRGSDMKHEEIIRLYFQSWVDADSSRLGDFFAENIVYSECYGPEYRGIRQILRWFLDWQPHGRVLEWRIKRILHQGNTYAVEWFFRCIYDGVTDGFDGVSLIEFNEAGKITALREFQSKAEHVFPYGQ